MFNNMKNKIREKTGTEIPKFVPNSKLSVSSSRQGSESSLNSLSCPITDVNSYSGAIIQKTSDFREIDESSYNEWLKKEEEFQRILSEKDKESRRRELEYREQLEAKEKELAETVKLMEECKSKMIRYQEDKHQLEQYQLEEMSKIKHLLLTKEKESSEKAVALKESLALVETLKHEVTRLRPLEEQISNYESSTESDSNAKYADLTRELEDLKSKLEDSEIQSSYTNEQLKIDVQSLMRSLDDEKLKVKELEQSLQEERQQRDEAFLRNAQMSQEMQIAQCELRNSQQENDDLLVQLNASEMAVRSKSSDMDRLTQEVNELRSQVNGSRLSDLENELNEKNKTVRMLQQRLSDLKKTLQQELRNNTSESRNHTIELPRNHTSESRNNTSGEDTPPVQLVGTSSSGSLEDDVNFKYLKHVIIKFLTCRDYEAQHLTRAVAVLLRLSAEEEQILKDTLDVRGSWWPGRSRVLPR